MNTINLCYQCRECESECRMAYWFDVPPPLVLRYLQGGEIDKALSSLTPWLCASCETCATECPHRLDLSRVMGDLTTAARDMGFPARVAAAPRVSLQGANIRRRANELGLIPPLKELPRRLQFELGWLTHRLGNGTRRVFQARIGLPSAGRGHSSIALAELLAGIACVVLALPIALGFAVGLALHRVSKP